MENSSLNIFRELCDLVTQADFQNAQIEFLQQHAHKFEDTDENKLEYTEIHSQYVYILDEVIEANLKRKYSDDEITAFYTTFKANLAAYEAENADGLDCLYGFIDFAKFKEQVLKAKAGATDYSA